MIILYRIPCSIGETLFVVPSLVQIPTVLSVTGATNDPFVLVFNLATFSITTTNITIPTTVGGGLSGPITNAASVLSTTAIDTNLNDNTEEESTVVNVPPTATADQYEEPGNVSILPPHTTSSPTD